MCTVSHTTASVLGAVGEANDAACLPAPCIPQVCTDASLGANPKFLKDCRMVSPSPQTDVLVVELVEQGSEDHTVGVVQMPICSLVEAGTIVQW
jgi:hypothetical protein